MVSHKDANNSKKRVYDIPNNSKMCNEEGRNERFHMLLWVAFLLLLYFFNIFLVRSGSMKRCGARLMMRPLVADWIKRDEEHPARCGCV